MKPVLAVISRIGKPAADGGWHDGGIAVTGLPELDVAQVVKCREVLRESGSQPSTS
ncbi:hypothetical protein [Rhodococcus sp. OK302]|uniref:hypothetical protein n=1 Tax=Rhodococcus sp. OK302 TaxID=1882769 RepID=UPI001595297B|nr:hypothetical protein [Rhodococcus sp. OK302]